jgi:hypothetical protein
VARIRASLGFDPEHEDMQGRLTPARDMQNAYALGGKTYAKGDAQVTVDALDYTYIYTVVADRLPYLRKLCHAIDSFLMSN